MLLLREVRIICSGNYFLSIYLNAKSTKYCHQNISTFFRRHHIASTHIKIINCVASICKKKASIFLLLDIYLQMVIVPIKEWRVDLSIFAKLSFKNLFFHIIL